MDHGAATEEPDPALSELHLRKPGAGARHPFGDREDIAGSPGVDLDQGVQGRGRGGLVGSDAVSSPPPIVTTATMAASATATAAAPTIVRTRRDARGRVTPVARRAAAIAPAVANRSSGRLAIALVDLAADRRDRGASLVLGFGGVLVQMGVDGRHLGVPEERRGTGQALVQHAAERIDIGPSVDLAALDLFGRDVVDVPMNWPVFVMSVSTWFVGSARNPSGRRGLERPSKMLPGLTSRWIRPRSCAASSASAIWAQIGAARFGVSAPSVKRSVPRSVPST